jgi:branched-chain amino acid transport system substrate-binding protein
MEGWRKTLALCACLLVAVAIAACGSSSSKSSSSGGSSGSSGSTASSSTSSSATSSSSSSGGASPGASATASKTITPATISAVKAFTGGTPGKANPALPPVTIGYVNEEGVAPSFPQYHGVTTAAVNFINNYMGGIDGHPLKLDVCILQSEEDGQQCAAQFRKNPSIHIAILGLAVVGNQSFYSTINGAFPTIVDVSATGPDATTPMVYALDGGGAGVLNAEATAVKGLGAKDVALLTTNNPSGVNTAEKVQAPRLKQLGVSPKIVLFPDTATVPTFVSSLANSAASTAGAIAFNPGADEQCNELHDALKQLSISTPVVTNVFCAADQVLSYTGTGLDGWVFSSFGWNPRVAGNAQSDAYSNVLTAAGQPSLINAGYTFKSFADIMAVAKFANQIGFSKLSNTTFNQAILKWRGPAWMIPGPIHCGVQKVTIGVCGTEGENSTYKNGQWKSLGAVALPAAN